MDARAQARRLLDSTFALALQRNEFEVATPIRDIATGDRRVRGAGALETSAARPARARPISFRSPKKPA